MEAKILMWIENDVQQKDIRKKILILRHFCKHIGDGGVLNKDEIHEMEKVVFYIEITPLVLCRSRTSSDSKREVCLKMEKVLA